MKKSYFKFPEVSRLRKLERVDASSDLVANVLALQDGEYLSFSRGVLPGKYGARSEEKRLPVSWMPSFDSEDEALEFYAAHGANVLGTRNANFGLMNVGESLAYGWKPLRGKVKVVPFAEVLEGARLFSYSHSDTFGIRPVDVERVYGQGLRGDDAFVAVPSRTKNQGRYKFKVEHLPVKRKNVGLVSEAFDTDHKCDRKSFYMNHKFGLKGVELVCAHEVAAMMAVAEHFSPGNDGPLWYSPLAIPSMDLVREYAKLVTKVLVEEEGKKARPFGLIERSFVVGAGLIPIMGVERCFPNNHQGLVEMLRDLKNFDGWNARNL